MNSTKRNRKIGTAVVCGAAILVGIVLILLGVAELVTTGRKNQTYEETNGVVIGYEETYHKTEPGHSGYYSYDSIVEYEADGKTYTMVVDSESGYKEEIGEEHIVRYHPLNPEDAYIGDGIPGWVSTVFAGLLFIVIPAFGLVIGSGNKKMIDLLLPLVLGGTGAIILFFSYSAARTLNPIKNPISLIGYIFEGVTVLALVGVFSMKKEPGRGSRSRGRGSEADSQNIYSDEIEGTRAQVIRITPIAGTEKEILFRKEGRQDIYYVYFTSETGYFDLNRTYVILRKNIEKSTTPVFRNGVQAYDLGTLQIPVTDFIPD